MKFLKDTSLQKPSPGAANVHHDSAEALRQRFLKNGCFRTPKLQRRKADSRGYKKGYEIRLVAKDKSDLARLRRTLISVGFKPGTPYSKHSYFIQPVYGRDAVARFRSLLD